MAAYSAEYYQKHKKAINAQTAEYHATNTKFIGLRFNAYHDWDILARLDYEDNKTGYIKQLIREDIKRTGFDPGPKPKKPGEPPNPADLPPVQPVPTVDLSAEEEARRLLGL